jgi:hypothetical protein
MRFFLAVSLFFLLSSAIGFVDADPLDRQNIEYALDIMTNNKEDIYAFETNADAYSNKFLVIGFGEEERDYNNRYLFYMVNNLTQKCFYVTDLRNDAICFQETVFRAERDYVTKIKNILDMVFEKYRIKPYNDIPSLFPIELDADRNIELKFKIYQGEGDCEGYTRYYLCTLRISNGKIGFLDLDNFIFSTDRLFSDEPLFFKYIGDPVRDDRIGIVSIIPIIDNKNGFKYVYKLTGRGTRVAYWEVESEEVYPKSDRWDWRGYIDRQPQQ